MTYYSAKIEYSIKTGWYLLMTSWVSLSKKCASVEAIFRNSMFDPLALKQFYLFTRLILQMDKFY